MGHEPADEFYGMERHGFLLVSVAVIAPVERNKAVNHVDDPIVRDGNAVSVPPEVFNHLLRVTKRFLAIDNPICPVNGSQQRPELFWAIQMG